MIEKYKFYSFFSKYSLMENYGFSSGLASRIFRKFVPEVPEHDSFEFYLRSYTEPSKEVFDTLKALIANPTCKASVKADLNKAIATLCTKIISFGFDYKFQSIFNRLNIDTSCYDQLLSQVSALSNEGEISFPNFEESLEEVYDTIIKIRNNKNVIGISLHLTVVTKNLLNYIERTNKLLELKSDIHSEEKWEELIVEYIEYDKAKNRLGNYFGAHMDLLAHEIVEHTAQKGEIYVADNKREYKDFFGKGLIGGLVVSVFALFKILIGSTFSEPIALALLFSINYALSFVIVSYWGGVIATKQPAMTAATIAKHIDRDGGLSIDTLPDIVLMIRKISRSQFISMMGNFLMALSASSLLAYLLGRGYTANPVYPEKSIHLVEQVFPFSGGALFYAAIAGVFLSASGFISGYFDNKIKASNLSYRIRNNKFLTRHWSAKKIDLLVLNTEKSLGVHSGNISLGIFLGTAFLFSYFLPFDIDIRHIAFSSANIGYGLVNQAFSLQTIALALVSVLLIGFVNFAVSFSITFFIVLKSRNIKVTKLRRLIRLSVKDIISHPLDYIMIRKGNKSN